MFFWTYLSLSSLQKMSYFYLFFTQHQRMCWSISYFQSLVHLIFSLVHLSNLPLIFQLQQQLHKDIQVFFQLVNYHLWIKFFQAKHKKLVIFFNRKYRHFPLMDIEYFKIIHFHKRNNLFPVRYFHSIYHRKVPLFLYYSFLLVFTLWFLIIFFFYIYS
jgi:hypothetical protein